MATSTTLDPQIVNLSQAIRQVESGGNPAAQGASGEYGLYQFEPTTWDATASKYGVNVPLQQATPEQQNEVAYKQLADWKQQHPDWNVGNFASAWNAGIGEPNAYTGSFSNGKPATGVNPKGVKFDVPTYAKSVATAYQNFKSKSSSQNINGQSPSPTSVSQNTPSSDQSAGSTLGSIFSGVGKAIDSTAKTLSNVGVGIGTTIGKTGLGLGKAYLEGTASLAGIMGDDTGKQAAESLAGGVQDISDAVYDKPFKAQQNTTSGKIGDVLGQAAVLAAPTDTVAAAKDTTGVIGDIAGDITKEILPGKTGKAVSYVTQKVLNAIPEATSGYVYGRSQGQKPEGAAGTAALFGGLSTAGEVAGDTYDALKGGVAENVGKAIGMTGKMNATTALEKIPQATRALTFIKNLAPNITVSDADGVEKTFDPSKATFGETLQALKQAKDQVYGAYSELAKKAGDEGSKFGQADFNTLIKTLQDSTSDTTSAFKNKAGSLIKDIQDNFGTVNPKDGNVYFKDADLPRLQAFLEKVNTDVNPMSDKAGAQVSGTFSQTLRKILDNKITSSTGEGYQSLRSTYGDLRSIEDNLVNQFKKTARGSGGVIGKYVEGFGGLDFLTSMLEQNPVGMAKSAGMFAIGKYMNMLKDPEVALQRAFQAMDETPVSSAVARTVGK